jgi:ribosomal protein S18 acetylase RimI-like enzyme
MDIDLATPRDQIEWDQDQCPWNLEETNKFHHCAEKNTSICKYFSGVEYLDKVLCSYPILDKKLDEIDLSGGVEIQGPFTGKSAMCEPVLLALAEWFGIEEANKQYLKDIQRMPTFLATKGNLVIGFLTIKTHFARTAEIHVMGLLPEYHGQGIGRSLLTHAEKYLREMGIKYLQVKTLSSSHPDEYYARTRAFYYAVGFDGLEEHPTLWGELNPCLQMIKFID